VRGFVRECTRFSLCGLNCALCTMQLGGYCPGCGGGEGNQSCRIARCSLEHGGVRFCSGCPDYPCPLYEGFDDADSFITHSARRRVPATGTLFGRGQILKHPKVPLLRGAFSLPGTGNKTVAPGAARDPAPAKRLLRLKTPGPVHTNRPRRLFSFQNL